MDAVDPDLVGVEVVGIGFAHTPRGLISISISHQHETNVHAKMNSIIYVFLAYVAREKKRAFSFTCTAAPQLKRPPRLVVCLYDLSCPRTRSSQSRHIYS